MDRILNMILRRLVNKGLNSGMKAMSKRGEGQGKQSQEDRALAQQGKQNSKNLRQASRLIRRINRF